MKRRSLWVTSIIGFLVATTLAFQNCNNKKFAATYSSKVNGTLDSMDTGGQITGEVHDPACDEYDEIQAGNCPESGIIKFYAIETDHSKTFIGTTEATLVNDGVDANNKPKFKYVFSFTVPAEDTCKPVEAYAVDPVTKQEVLIQPDADFILWGDKSKCQQISGGGGGGGGSVTIDDVKQDGRLVQVSGSCSGSAAVVASGDLNALIGKSDACSSGAYKHCDFLANDAAANSITEKQGSAQDTVNNLTGANPALVITFDSFTKSAGNTSGHSRIDVAGKCTPGAKVKLIIYNGIVSNTTCPSNGMYSVGGDWLVNGLQNRVLTGKLESPFGNAEISYDVDHTADVPSCAITQVTARADFCTKQAASIKASCTNGLPVSVSVNGHAQQLGYCASGTVTLPNVLLEQLGSNNVVKIEQVTPYGKSCSGTQTVTTF